MSLNQIPSSDNPIADKVGRLTAVWQAFFASLHLFAGPLGNNGTTATRPVHSTNHPLYVGQGYFDTTLGFMIWVKTANPTVWVRYDGTAV